MAKTKNLLIHPKTSQELDRLIDEYKFIGREVTWNRDTLSLTVLALPSEYKAKKERESRRQARKEREEEERTSYARS